MLIVGPVDTGKSTLARILLNYAVRGGTLAPVPSRYDPRAPPWPLCSAAEAKVHASSSHGGACPLQLRRLGLSAAPLLQQRHSCGATAPLPRPLVRPWASGCCSSLLRLGPCTCAGWAPALVDLDLGQGSITCPGTLSAVPLEASAFPHPSSSSSSRRA